MTQKNMVVTAAEVQVGDLLAGFWVHAIAMDNHYGRAARRFNLSDTRSAPGVTEVGRATFASDTELSVVR